MTTRTASPKQLAFVNGLLAQRDVDAEWLDRKLRHADDLSEWTPREISELIDGLKSFPWKPRPVDPSTQALGFLGAVGAKLTNVPATITVNRVVSNQFGDSKLIVARTESGKLVKTFGTGATLWDKEVGDQVLVSGTVKEQETYQGQDQTTLTRVKLELVRAAQDQPEAQEEPREELWSDSFKYETPPGFATPVGELGNPVFAANIDPVVTSDYRASEIEDLLGHFGK